VGSGKYHYCVLSDFGLACEDRRDKDPAANEHQKSRSKLGTLAYWAPELCHDPYPQTQPYATHPDIQFKLFPNGNRHSCYSDVWALGASIYNLCNAEPPHGAYSHLNFDNKPYHISSSTFMEGTKSRKNPLNIPSSYSEHLQNAIRLATTWRPNDRPDAIALVKELKRLNIYAGYDNHATAEKLPDWATRVHEYLGKAEKMYPN
jgi:serine/threonine protein kinase